MKLLNYALGEWVAGTSAGTIVRDAVSGEPVGSCSSEGLDFRAMAEFGRSVGGTKLRSMTFHERAAMVKRLATYLTEHKATLY